MANVKRIKIRGQTIDIGGGSSSSGMELLWENPSPNASFAGQTITLSDDVENYDYIGIICSNGGSSADTRKRFLPIVLIPTSSAMGASITVAAYRNYRRNATEISGKTIKFDNCEYFANYGTNTGTTSNANIIPRQVLGFKN